MYDALYRLLEAAWIAEAKRRLEDVRSGKSKLIPSEEVERELEEIISASESRQQLAR